MHPHFPNPHSQGCFWFDWTNLIGASDNGLCEAMACGMIAKPAAAWSNLAYLAVAIYFFQRDKKLSLYIALVGVVSFFAHASSLYPALLLDLGTSFSLLGWAVSRNLRRKNFIPYVIGAGIFSVVTCHLLLMNGFHYRYIFPVGALIVVFLEFQGERKKSKYLHMAMGILALAFFFAAMDGSDIFCRPQSWLQGHAIWHLLTALALPYLERHYKDLSSSAEMA